MPLFLLLKYLRDGKEYAALFDIAELVVHCRAEHPHCRRQPHIGVHERRNAVAVAAHLGVEYAEIALEVAAAEQGVELGLGRRRAQRRYRPHQTVGVGEILVEEVEYHVAAHRRVARVHGHLSEEIAYLGIDNRERAEAVPKVVESVYGLCAGS